MVSPKRLELKKIVALSFEDLRYTNKNFTYQIDPKELQKLKYSAKSKIVLSDFKKKYSFLKNFK